MEKNIIFMTYDNTYGEINKVHAFIQQFDATLDWKDFEKGSKPFHVAMYIQMSGQKWRFKLGMMSTAPKT